MNQEPFQAAAPQQEGPAQPGMTSLPPQMVSIGGASYQAMPTPHRTRKVAFGIVAFIFTLAVILGAGSWALAMTTTESLWDNSAKPEVASTSATQSVELGMKFQTTVSGQITGLRFYKGKDNTGTHVGSLWDKNGNRLASVTFQNESSEGWQSATFKQPVQIAGNVTYVISYFAPHGHNAVNANYFNKPFAHKRVTGLNDGWDGGNGVFTFGDSPSFPLSSSNASNYWVDPVFTSKVYRAQSTPSQPASFQATPEQKSVTLQWLPSVSATPIQNYEVYRNGKLLKTVSADSPVATTATHLPIATTGATLEGDAALAFSQSKATAQLAATTTVNNSANNTATGANQSSTTSQNTTKSTSDTTTTTKEHYEYVDKSVSPGTTYTYQVKAVDTSKKTSDVSKTTATVPKSGETAKAQPSTTESNGGTTITVNNSANNTATGANQSSTTSQNTTTNSDGTTTTTTDNSGTQNTGTSGSATGSTSTTTTGTTATTPKTAQQLKDYIKSAQQKALSSGSGSSSSSVWQNYQDNYDWSNLFDDSQWNIDGSTGSSSSSSTNTSTSSGSYQYNSNLSNSAN